MHLDPHTPEGQAFLADAACDLTVDVYVAQRRPVHEFGVAVYRGRLELAREEEFWTRQKAEAAVPRILASLATEEADDLREPVMGWREVV